MNKRNLIAAVVTVAAIPLFACALATPAAAGSNSVVATARNNDGYVVATFTNYSAKEEATCSAQLDDYSTPGGVVGPLGVTVPARPAVGWEPTQRSLVFWTAPAGHWRVEWVCRDSTESWGTVPMTPNPTDQPIAVTTGEYPIAEGVGSVNQLSGGLLGGLVGGVVCAILGPSDRMCFPSTD